MKHIVCKVGQLQPGHLMEVMAGTKSIVVIRCRNGEYRALRNVCAHQGAPLSAGSVEPMLTATRVGEYAIVAGKDVLRCGWHGYEYDVETGRSLVEPDRVRVKTYDVRIEGDNVVVNV